MRVNHALLLAFLTIFGTTGSTLWAAAPLSKYGQIQNVQSYSSNPFWTPDAPYNQRMPTPVYATGTDIETIDCQRVTSNLVAAICATMNNCATATLADVRPTLITQMSRMPGGNYATACAGYLDTAFSDYVRKNSHAGALVTGATFPTPTTPNPNAQETTFTDPFAPKTPQWATDAQQRKQELQNLKDASDTETPGLNTAAFPTTYADLSFTDRMQNAAEGYVPFKNNDAYKQITVSASTATGNVSHSQTTNSARTDGTAQTPTPSLSNNQTESVSGEILFIL